MYRFDRAQLEELRLLREQAERLGTNPETFAAGYFGLTLDQYRVWIATGEKPTGYSDE